MCYRNMKTSSFSKTLEAASSEKMDLVKSNLFKCFFVHFKTTFDENKCKISLALYILYICLEYRL